MSFDLCGRNILLGVTGSISAYKACELARLYIKAGASVHVVMTPAAERFVSALSFEALTRNRVLTEASESWSSTLNHIETGKACELFVIAPATANTLNKLSKGIADNILLQTALAYAGPIVVAPAANTQMIKNHYTAGSLKMLAVNEYHIVESQNKQLACGDTGEGGLAEPQQIFLKSMQALFEDSFWKDRRVVVTSGGTREKIDEVRCLTNFSSGKMGKALALALYSRGADVCYITTTGTDGLPTDLYTLEIDSAKEMLDYTRDAVRVAKKGKMSRATMNSAEPVHLIQKEPYLFMAAAVADYTPRFPQQGKLKKIALGDQWTLELTQTPDILSTIDKSDIQVVAFKAEMDAENGLQAAKKLMQTKGAHAVCYNLLRDAESFGSDTHAVTFLTPTKELSLDPCDKLTLACNILDAAKEMSE
jgi:phosphopantothenoylcysteine decarboxylase / phosphopantothenate---cysteine ligase